MSTKFYDYNIAILKIFACFLVILSHFWVLKETDNYFISILSIMRYCPVPIFIFLSFYLMHDTFISKSNTLFKKRLLRLGYPYFIWTCFYSLVYFLFDYFGNWNINLHFSDFIYQFLLGSDRKLCSHFWFFVDLFVLTTLFYLLGYVKKKNMIYILCFLIFVSFFMQYSGLNFRLWGKYSFEIRYTTGRLFEILPYAAMGFIFAQYNIFKQIPQKIYIAIILICLFFASFYSPTDIYNFGYTGIVLYIRTIIFILLIKMIPMDKSPKWIQKTLQYIATYTLGIYCIHLFVGKICTYYIFSEKSIFTCCMIFLLSFLLILCFSLFKISYIQKSIK